jgi:hypothetical protein
MNMNLDLDELLEGMTRDGMRKFVKKLLAASEEEERDMLASLDKRAASAEKESGDLADLKDEKKGKPSPVDMNAEPTRRKRDG